ncbi:dihydrolipoamide acetyltransferase family protein [Lutispora saccharofermentans]|uniref:Dihydrolipoamide acetyltransferase component of pyruvate dehydrogenase complex n=1 Tax=Lutispora saccharofermentans TaxID=3024236 RepID=A0ABT1NGS4_9FIRM|nr:dihydrolipoamide acetyltransferase family protein [Lutispora saccharofermentans]MCQ1529323.1 2-oxo acid dehydrogenase subunit E2 [Lutispora saccharofermentans]
MAVEVNMPRLGMTMKEGTLVKWLKREGDHVKKGESLAEITSEKITNEIEAPSDGILDKILVGENETVDVGVVVAYIAESSGERSTVQGEAVGNGKEQQEAKGPKTILEEKPLSGLRKVIGERMAESLRRSPQGTMTTRADVTQIIALKNDYAEQGHKVTVTDIFVKIVGLALEKNPVLNASIEDNKLIFYKSVNIGVGVGTEEGLFVPVIKNVETKSVLDISRELKALAKKIKDKSINSDDMTGGTFTISNLGMFDVDIVTPIINPPEAAILAIGTTRKEVVVSEDGTMAVRPITTLSLTADHAVMDGLPAVRFLTSIKEIMANLNGYLV